jgi:hypothetical protein
VVVSVTQSIPVDRDAPDLEPIRLELQAALERARHSAEAHFAATQKKRS